MDDYKTGDKVVLSTPSSLYGEGVIVCKLVDVEGFSIDFTRLEGGIENLWLTGDEIKPVEGEAAMKDGE